MTYTNGYPDVILGYWRGIEVDNQKTDDNTIYQVVEAEGESQYIFRIVKLGSIFKSGGFKEGEVVIWVNPAGKPGFYKIKIKNRR